MKTNGASISLVCSLFIMQNPKLPDSSWVQTPYSDKSSSELLCLLLNNEGPNNPKLVTRLSPTCRSMYGADTTVVQLYYPPAFCPELWGGGGHINPSLVKDMYGLPWWSGGEQQHAFPGLTARLPHKGEGWEAPGSGKAGVMKESVMIRWCGDISSWNIFW